MNEPEYVCTRILQMLSEISSEGTEKEIIINVNGEGTASVRCSVGENTAFLERRMTGTLSRGAELSMNVNPISTHLPEKAMTAVAGPVAGSESVSAEDKMLLPNSDAESVFM
ncbi:hypothetical protein [Enterobacter cancerogenus]